MGKEKRMLVNMLLISSVLMGLLGGFLKYQVLQPMGIVREESVMALPFLFLADDMLAYEVKAAQARLEQPAEPTVPTEIKEPIATEAPTVPQTEPSTSPVTEEPSIPVTEPVTEPPTEPAPVYQAVDESWFDDALFIGDSRTVGLRDYARLGDADYFCKVSMSVFNVMEWETFDEDFMYDTLDEVLSDKTYGKIYIHLGLNEVGQDKDEIISKYQELIDMIRQYQPNAKIIIQAIMSVTRDKAQNTYFSLENIQEVNARLQKLAQEQGFLFEDVNQWVADEEGYMYEELSFDGCHLYGKGYLDWRQWIWDSAGWYGIP